MTAKRRAWLEKLEPIYVADGSERLWKVRLAGQSRASGQSPIPGELAASTN